MAANLPLSPAPLSTQTRSDQLLELAKLQPAPRETPEQRQEKWVLNRMDVVVWTLVEHDSTRFWWPANVRVCIARVCRGGGALTGPR